MHFICTVLLEIRGLYSFEFCQKQVSSKETNSEQQYDVDIIFSSFLHLNDVMQLDRVKIFFFPLLLVS